MTVVRATYLKMRDIMEKTKFGSSQTTLRGVLQQLEKYLKTYDTYEKTLKTFAVKHKALLELGISMVEKQKENMKSVREILYHLYKYLPSDEQ